MRIPLIPIILLIIFSILADLYILKDLHDYCKSRYRKAIQWCYGISSVLLWAFLIVVICLPRGNAEDSILPLMWMIFSYLSVYLPKFIYVICSLVGRLFPKRKGNRLNYGAMTGIVIGIIAFVSMWWGVLYTRHQVEVNRVEIASAKLPSSFEGFKVVQFSDTHLGTWGNDTAFIAKMVDSINAQKPDLVLFTGDWVNRKASEMKPFVSVLSRIKAKYGKYGVYGNHDYGGYVNWENQKDYKQNLVDRDSLSEAAGFQMLLNETAFIRNGNDSIVLIGVHNWGEPPFRGLGDLGKSYPDQQDHLRGLNDGMYKILMTHNPMHWSEVATKISNIDFTMSGHTHAMQIMAKFGKFQWSPASFRYPDWGGLYTTVAKDGTPMNLYVNIGAGEVGFPARLWSAYPEITVFTLRKK